jgi:hypothetical protein
VETLLRGKLVVSPEQRIVLVRKQHALVLNFINQ